MSELEDILNYLETTSLEPHDDYVSEFSYKDQKTLWKYIKELQQENQELKKRLEVKEAQQKEFIEYLENEINKINEQIKNYDIWHEAGTDINFLILKKQFNIEILSKYKEIIGG